MTHIDILNRRLAESLGRVCSGTFPRYKWFYAPEMPYFVYDRDDRTLLKRTWADAPGPDGNPIGKVWLLGGWRINKTLDHFGYGEGVRVPHVQKAGYAPHFETALPPGQPPNDEITAWIIHKIDAQLSISAEIVGEERSMDQYMAEEHYSELRNKRAFANEHLERSRHVYDDNVGAFGNCEVGVGDGFLSWGGVGDSPVVRKLTEAST